MTTTTIRPTFELNGTTYSYNEGNHQYYLDEKNGAIKVHRKISKADYEIALATFNNPPAPKTEPKPEGKPEKAKGPTTAENFLAKIPAKFVYRTNNKGHILIAMSKDDKTTICRVRPTKAGAFVFPGKKLKATRDDWDFHAGWANEYSKTVANWDEIDNLLKPVLEPEA